MRLCCMQLHAESLRRMKDTSIEEEEHETYDDDYPADFQMHLVVSSCDDCIDTCHYVWRVVTISRNHNSWRFVNSAAEIDLDGGLRTRKEATRLWHEMQRREFADLGETYYVRKFKCISMEAPDEDDK